ncbi:helix-turn-helix domain-containing protein [Caproiciproducens galactitolivorans]|uniref:helix-turn-helix domain-containing protein n=1 Tax=Caproiciproducens galactitolivorans TaxID=642589 RepID=UPI002409D9E5|nr:helix-turn-helix transcriptional regulator [Caproiciproducens galactitolivorans]
MEHTNVHCLGNILKAARKSKGFTREIFAEMMGITPRYLSSLENENKKPSYDLLYRLIRKLGISADMVFYPESESTSGEIEQLTRMLSLCDQQDLNIVNATLTAILDNKAQAKAV